MCCNAMWSGNSNAAVQGQDSSTSFRQSFRGLRLAPVHHVVSTSMPGPAQAV